MRWVAIVVAAVALVGCSSPSIPPSAIRPEVGVTDELLALAESRSRTSNEPYRVSPGDRISTTVFGAEDLNAAARVSPSGMINAPLLGGVRVEGLTEGEIRAKLENAYGSRYIIDPSITVFIERARMPKCRVFGSISRPGTYELQPGATLLDVISSAGGVAGTAGPVAYLVPAESQDNAINMIEYSRAASDTPDVSSAPASEHPTYSPNYSSSIPIPLRTLIEDGDPRINLPMRDGDTLTVLANRSIYVTGAVQKPGAVGLTPTLTLTQALSLAGGSSGGALLPDTRIMRQNPDGGDPIRIVADVRAILESKAPDVKLEADDVIFVPQNTFKAVYNEAFRYLFLVISLGLRAF